jgi:hypothetical protein
MFGAVDNNDLVMLIESRDNFEALLVTNKEKQKKALQKL